MHWFKKYKIIIIIILSLSFLLFNFQPVLAAECPPADNNVLWSSIPDDCRCGGFCTTCHLVQIVVNAGVFILGIIGAVALLFFVYGGFTILASGGSSEKVKKGKDIIVNSVIGLTIALLAWLVINLIITTVAGGWTWQSKLKCPEPPSTPVSSPASTTCTESCVTSNWC